MFNFKKTPPNPNPDAPPTPEAPSPDPATPKRKIKLRPLFVHFIRFVTFVALLFAFIIEILYLAHVLVSQKANPDMQKGLLPGTDVPAGKEFVAGFVIARLLRCAFFVRAWLSVITKTAIDLRIMPDGFIDMMPKTKDVVDKWFGIPGGRTEQVFDVPTAFLLLLLGAELVPRDSIDAVHAAGWFLFAVGLITVLANVIWIKVLKEDPTSAGGPDDEEEEEDEEKAPGSSPESTTTHETAAQQKFKALYSKGAALRPTAAPKVEPTPSYSSSATTLDAGQTRAGEQAAYGRGSVHYPDGYRFGPAHNNTGEAAQGT